MTPAASRYGRGTSNSFLSGLKHPPQTTTMSISDALRFPAIQLFISKAYGLGDIKPTDECVPQCCSICSRLDGLALAIELAPPVRPVFFSLCAR